MLASRAGAKPSVDRGTSKDLMRQLECRGGFANIPSHRPLFEIVNLFKVLPRAGAAEETLKSVHSPRKKLRARSLIPK